MLLKQSTVKMLHTHAGKTLSTSHIPFSCHQVNILFRHSDLFPKATIPTFPTDVLYNPQYFVPLAHLLLKSPTDVLYNPQYFVPLAHLIPKSQIGPLIWIVYECILMWCLLVHIYAFYCEYCSRAINYCNIIKHDSYIKICLISPQC